MDSCSEPYPNQRVYTGTIVQDQATAHFGDSYTTYHIHTGRGQNGDTGPAPLTVRQSLTGLVTASTLAIETISRSKDAAPITQEIQSELTKLKIVIAALETLIERTYSVAPTRAALIPVQDVVTVLTQLILVFTELQDFLDRLTADSSLRLSKASSSAARLLHQLMRHQLSLSLILQIIQCDSQNQAGVAAVTLQQRIDQDLDDDMDLATRIQGIETPVDTTVTSYETNPSDTIEDQSQKVRGPAVVAGDYISRPFDLITAQTRAYRRVELMEIDCGSICSTARSHGWSALSGISLSQITCIAVINLPLDPFEIRRFRESTILTPPTSLVQNALTWAEPQIAEALCPEHLQEPRLNDHGYPIYIYPLVPLSSYGFERVAREWTTFPKNVPFYSAGPLDDFTERWEGVLIGQYTPYEGGCFLLDIVFYGKYPEIPPQIRFVTPIHHPDVDSSGFVFLNFLCLSIVGRFWSPQLSLDKALLAISTALGRRVDHHTPGASTLPHIPADEKSYNHTARKLTRTYATQTGPDTIGKHQALSSHVKTYLKQRWDGRKDRTSPNGEGNN